MTPYILIPMYGLFSFFLGYYKGSRPKVTFYEPTDEITDFMEFKKPNKVLFAEPVIPREVFKESKTIDEFINKI